MGDIFKYWGDVDFYHNINIKPVEGGGYIIDRSASDIGNLYTELIPEGPRLLVNFNEIINQPEMQEKIITKQVTTKISLIPEVKKLPSVEDYHDTLDTDSNFFIKGKLSELVNFLEVEYGLEDTQSTVRENWQSMYETLESEVNVTNSDGSITSLKFNELSEDQLDLYPKGLLEIKSRKTNDLLQSRR